MAERLAHGTAGSFRRAAERLARAPQKAGVAIVFLLALLASWSLAAWAQTAPDLHVAVYEATASATPRQIEALPASTFQSLSGAMLPLHGGPGKTIWLRLDTELPVVDDEQASRWMLWINRAAVDRIVLHPAAGKVVYPGADFFLPRDTTVEHDSGYAFVLSRTTGGPVTMYLEVAAQGDFALSLRLRNEADVVAADRFEIMLTTALYAGLALLLLLGGGMYGALRDRQYIYYMAYVGAALAFLLAHNGPLYAMPWVKHWGHFRTLGLCALVNVLAAATVATTRGFAGLSRAMPAFDRALKFFLFVPGVLVLACLVNMPASVPALQVASLLDQVLAGMLAVATTALAWRHQRNLAPPMLLMWLLVLATGTARALADLGLVAGNEWIGYADQMMLAFNALLMGFALTDHIIEFRLQRDRASLAKDQADASLKMERERLKFIEALHTTLRDAPSGDQEWLAFRRLLEVIRELVPQYSSAVALHAFHDNDLLLCEPNTTREAYITLLATRGGAFKGISRSQLPMQLRVDSPMTVDGSAPDLIQYAVLPLPLTAPAWGMLLIERRGWQGFERDELAVAAELAQKAARAVEDAANDRVMRINAEFDALTAVFNRRTMDNRLAAYFKESIQRRTPLVVLFADLDQLKDINDAHGHATGDQCLRALADVLKAHCGTSAVVGRFSGDEFVVILPDLNPEQARRWAEAVRIEVNGMEMEFGSKKLRLRVNIGMASRLAEDADANQLVERAEKALANARRAGRDQVEVAAIHRSVGGTSSR
ncbi:MAG TPA: diguanylate cyclase [Xanthomonadaceae bacterium]|jgi:diguanylate cyclase (GGDEF)-like protein